MIRATHTYAILQVSKEAYQEVKTLLLKAGYDQAIHKNSRGDEVIDMHGIALGTDDPDRPEPQPHPRAYE